jgi:Tfp pilus assembly protein PilF
MKRLLLALGVAAAVVLLIVLVIRQPGSALPEPGSEAYEQVSRAFYHGLAALEVGLLDDARMQFTRATELVPEEPASWANLAVAQLRLGELDAAADPIMRALALAPDHASLLLLSARAEIARGRLDEGIAQLRRAVEQDPEGLRTRVALAEEVERAAGPDADAEALRLLDRLIALAPGNAVILLERARLAAKANDAERLQDSIDRLMTRAAAWPAAVQEQFGALRQAAEAGDSASAVRATILMRNLLTAVPSFREELADVRTPTELVAEPLDRFVRLVPPPATPSAPDTALSFQAEPIGDVLVDPAVVFSVPVGEGTAVELLAAYRTLRRVGGEEIAPTAASGWRDAVGGGRRGRRLEQRLSHRPRRGVRSRAWSLAPPGGRHAGGRTVDAVCVQQRLGGGSRDGWRSGPDRRTSGC